MSAAFADPEKQRMDSLVRVPESSDAATADEPVSRSSLPSNHGVGHRPCGDRHRLLALCAGLALTGLTLIGCSGGDDGTISFRVVGPPQPVAGSCPDSESAVDGAPLEFVAPVPDRVRMTYLQAEGPDNPLPAADRFLCDVVLDYATDEPPVVQIPTADGELDMAVEFFAQNTLVASGTVTGVAARTTAPVEIPALPIQAFACAGDRLSTARAFHSATLLPTGDVLLVGGVADPNDTGIDPAAGLYLTDSIDIFNPETETFTPLSAPGLLPRALHEAYVISEPDSPTVTIALLGGITVSGNPDDTPALVAGQDGLRLAPEVNAIAAPVELLDYDPNTGNLTRADVPNSTPDILASLTDAASMGPGAVPVSVGGQEIVLDANMNPVLQAVVGFQMIDGETWGLGAKVATTAARRGATVTDLGAGQVLIWGGHMRAQAGQLITQAGELLTGVDGVQTPVAQALAFGVAAPAPRAFHSAVPGNPGDVLVFGGFEIVDGSATAPAGFFAERITVGGAETLVAPIERQNGGAATAAGYVSAAALPGGDAVVSGGNPPLGYDGCSTAGAGIVCSIGDGYVYRGEIDRLVPLAGNLLVSRYGHRTTVLAGGKLLITGGLHAEGDALGVVADAEVLDPRDENVDITGLARSPAEIARDLDGLPLGECTLQGTAPPAE